MINAFKYFLYLFCASLLWNCSSVYYQRPQPIYGIETNKIPESYLGSYFKKNNQVTTDENNVTDSFFYFHPKLTIEPTSIRWYENSAKDTSKIVIYNFDCDTNRSIIMLTEDYIVFNLYNDFGKIHAYEAIFTRRNPKDSVIYFYSGLPGGQRQQRQHWQYNIRINKYDVLTNQILNDKDFKRLERKTTPVLALTKSNLQNTLQDEDDFRNEENGKPKIKLPHLFKSKSDRLAERTDKLTDKFAQNHMIEPTYIMFYEMSEFDKEGSSSGIAVLEKNFKHQDYQKAFSLFIEKSYPELMNVFNFQVYECALLSLKDCQELNLSLGQVKACSEEEIKQLKKKLNAQKRIMVLPYFWQDTTENVPLSWAHAKTKLKILIKEQISL